LSVLMKQNGIFFVLLATVFTLWFELEQSKRVRFGFVRAGLVLLGTTIPVLILGAVILMQGTFGNFWFWTIQYAREYVTRIPVAEAWSLFAKAVGDITQANVQIWVTACAGALLL